MAVMGLWGLILHGHGYEVNQRRVHFFGAFLLFGAFFFGGGAPFCFSAGKKEKKKEATRTWRENRTLSHKRSAALQNPKS